MYSISMSKESFKTSDDIRIFLNKKIYISKKNIRILDEKNIIGVEIGKCTISTSSIRTILDSGLMFFINNGIPTVYLSLRKREV